MYPSFLSAKQFNNFTVFDTIIGFCFFVYQFIFFQFSLIFFINLLFSFFSIFSSQILSPFLLFLFNLHIFKVNVLFLTYFQCKFSSFLLFFNQFAVFFSFLLFLFCFSFFLFQKFFINSIVFDLNYSFLKSISYVSLFLLFFVYFFIISLSIRFF